MNAGLELVSGLFCLGTQRCEGEQCHPWCTLRNDGQVDTLSTILWVVRAWSHWLCWPTWWGMQDIIPGQEQDSSSKSPSWGLTLPLGSKAPRAKPKGVWKLCTGLGCKSPVFFSAPWIVSNSVPELPCHHMINDRVADNTIFHKAQVNLAQLKFCKSSNLKPGECPQAKYLSCSHLR